MSEPVNVGTTSPSIWSRMIAAARLDVKLFEEVEADSKANGQALTVDGLASLATGIGAGISGLMLKGILWFLWGLLIGLGTAIVGWLLWALFAYWIGITLFKRLILKQRTGSY